MRRATILVAGLLLAVAPAGCGKAAGGDPTVATAQSAGTGRPAASATPSDDPDAPVKFARCMREHGMTWFPDPVEGRQTLKMPQNVKPEDFQAAQQACKQWAPDRVAGRKPSAEDMEKLRQMSKCMRENGVPNFPDPSAEGGIGLDSRMGIDPESPTFKAAEKKCEQYGPKPDDKHTENDEAGSGGNA
ncbi:hypothetical protein BJY16_002809 [Actinoplanes octamycinicus]|uniref:Lipoprotein n=1 Tax=Actinoplanes octamycinicus TaxID=135948 RepID=A0A7W7M720_9ACTN|nr:hypothetical protein [Actinoplanes octamycinicus]MBB4739350.1 hypothetical protein [Actinoplanes octamycinicus]GIE58674.1 hypothetical protein Aoc01nite_40760 [Actinoplanes octamycinicus]